MLKHIHIFSSATASQQSVKLCKICKVLTVIKHDLTAVEALFLLSHISWSYTIITIKRGLKQYVDFVIALNMDQNANAFG